MLTKHDIIAHIHEIQASGETIPPYNLMEFIVSHALLLQTDKSGTDYALHTTFVAQGTQSRTKQIIRKGHDLVEDSDWTFDDLKDVGFSERVIDGIDGMTHRAGELYFDSIQRCGLNPDSVDGKLQDLTHNLSQSRNTFIPDENDLERLKKYTVSYNYLVDIKKGEIESGTPVSVWMQTKPKEMQDFDLVARHSSGAETKPRTALRAPKP